MAYTIWAARILPPILLGIIAYVSWIDGITAQYFFDHDRHAAGIIILVFYWFLFALVVSSFLHMLSMIIIDPGYLDIGFPPSKPLNTADGPYHSSTLDRNPSLRLSRPAPRLIDIISKDVFMCEADGTPRWCSTCRIWRPDRSRHCREKNRCVLKLDHYCPWVGGIVSERSMKFFIQFNTYTFFYTIFSWVGSAACIADARSHPDYHVNGNWIASLTMGLFFMGLTGGIGASAWVCAMTNHTTPENVAEAYGHRWTLAIRVPPGSRVAAGVPTITFPLMLDASKEQLLQYLKVDSESPHDSLASTSTPQSEHTFAIVQSDEYSNPWDCGTLENWEQVMGRSIWYWILPIGPSGGWLSSEVYHKDRYGPMPAAEQPASFFPTGIDVEVMKAKAGLKILDPEEQQEYDRLMKRRQAFPYLFGGAGAPVKQWAAFMNARRRNASGEKAGQ